jgi:hypothetical protein
MPVEFFSAMSPPLSVRAGRAAVWISAFVAAFMLLTPLPAASAHRGSDAITGTLSKRGYTVIVLGYNGKAASSRSQSFRITAPASRVTLQLRDAYGKYAGPVIVGGGGSRVIEGIKPGARLGMIKVLAGYARTARPLAARFLDRGRWAQARRGVPLGNGRNFGLVRSRIHNGPSGPGGDSARSGVPNAFSIDPAGDGVISALKPTDALKLTGRLAADVAVFAPPPSGPPTGPPSGPPTGPSGFSFFSQIFLDLGQTLNADAAGVTRPEIDAMLSQHLNIVGANVPQGDVVALDCGGLTYCSAGGTGQLLTGGCAATCISQPNGTFVPFPSCCDPSSDGFGNLRGPDALGLGSDNHSNNWAFLYPRATSSQIGSGDAFVLRVTSAGALTQIPVTLGFVFDTVPALASYNDGAGDSGTISYPAPSGAPGTESNPIPLAANSTGDVVLSTKFWRPQRKGIPGAGEPTAMDIGHLQYTIDATNLAQNAAGSPAPGAPSPATASVCSAASLSTSDPSLSVSGGGSGLGFVVDSSADQPANPANLLSFNVDLTKCLTDAGASGFPVGAQGAIGLKAQAPNSGDHAVQNIWVKRVR